MISKLALWWLYRRHVPGIPIQARLCWVWSEENPDGSFTEFAKPAGTGLETRGVGDLEWRESLQQ